MICSDKYNQYVQGSTYTIAWTIRKKVGNKNVPITSEEIEAIQFNIGPVQKLYPLDVYYNAEKQAFIVNLTQEDTMSMPPMKAIRFARIKWKNGQVKCTKPIIDKVLKTGAREIL